VIRPKRSAGVRELFGTRARPRLGDFPLGSALSRAAARVLLKDRIHAANREADVRIVFDLTGGPSPGYVARSVDSKGKITDIIFPAHPDGEECYGVFPIAPSVELEEALQQAKTRQEVIAASRLKPIDVSQFLQAESKAQRQPIQSEAAQRCPRDHPKTLVN